MAGEAKLGSVVCIHYKGGVVGEEPIDVRVDGKPLRVLLGNMALPRGIENALIGMKAGDEKEIDVPAEAGYGTYQDHLVNWYPRMKMPDGYNLHVGEVLFYTNPEDGLKMPAWVVDETEDTVRIDFNHPFAGKDLRYWIHLEAVE